ncbi:TylF/MycF family methyltransferase [Opitutales bacterium]|nr:TylF/MycF family methyltransferase [Opitutales bacterium]
MKLRLFIRKIMHRIGNRLVAMSIDATSAVVPRDFRWNDPQNEQEAEEFLSKRIISSAKNLGVTKIILLGGKKDFRSNLAEILQESFTISSFESLESMIADADLDLSCTVIGITTLQANEIHRIGENLVRDPKTSNVAFEYVVIPKVENLAINRMYENSNDFISPLHLQEPNFSNLYEESCKLFEPKTGIRDFMDLIQGVNHVFNTNLQGDLAEFGSFKGQSGYLTARYLEVRKSPKTLFMFDAFESFPIESNGVDHFWSDTHKVNFEGIKQKFKRFNHVELVKGDFTETFNQSACKKLCLAFVDCDSYRGTKYLIDEIFEDRLVVGGLMIFEDYGHASLLGNRLAVHEKFKGKRNAFCFFSQFSGSFYVCKLQA